jgi:LAO/AO transport system kinase
MLGLRSGHSLQNVPAHHGVDLKRPLTPEQRRAMNPARLAREAARASEPAQWTPPVLRTVAAEGHGIAELADAIERHMQFLSTSGQLRVRRVKRLRERVIEVAERMARRRLWSDPATTDLLERSLTALESGETTPFDVAEMLLASAAPVVGGARIG